MTIQTNSNFLSDPSDNRTVIAGVFESNKELGRKTLCRLIDEILNAQLPSYKDKQSIPAGAGFHGLRPNAIKVFETETGSLIKSSQPHEQVSILIAALERLQRETTNDWFVSKICSQLLKSLLRKKLPYRSEDIERILATLVRDAKIYMMSEVPRLAAMGHVLKYVEKHGAKPAFKRSLLALKKTFHSEAYDAHCRKVGERVEAVLRHYDASGPTAEPGELSRDKFIGSLETGEVWTSTLLQNYERLPPTAQLRWFDFLEHCADATKSKPTKKWSRRAAELATKIGEPAFVSMLEPVFRSVGLPGKAEAFVMGSYRGFHDETQVHSQHINTLRGLAWSVSELGAHQLISTLGDVAAKCFEKIRGIGPRCPKIGNACLVSLAAIASPEAVAQLGRLKARTRHASTKKQIDRAYQKAAANAGLTRQDLIELGVPTFGLTNVGQFGQEFGSCRVEVQIRSHGKSLVSWTNAKGKTQKSIPAEVKSESAEELKDFKKKLKEIETLIPSIRQRVESLFRIKRSWSLEDFRERYLDHPVVGVLARRLVWKFQIAGTWKSAIWHEGIFVDARNRPLESWSEADSVSLWHPMDVDADKVVAWRNWLIEQQVTQPFKQAHREVYILTDAEIETATYSNRFAAHILRQHQLNALCQQRGWRYSLQGLWDSFNSPHLELPESDLSVEFFVEPIEDGEATAHMVFNHLVSDQVRFYREREGNQEIVALVDIDSRLFSEVMRDVDLFVGVTSVGNDPQWRDQGDGRLNEYWYDFSFGDLTESATTRRQTLESIVPSLKIAEQCQFDGNFLKVTGQLRTYKIHLGSGNILMEPNDQYLCIVRGGRSKPSAQNVFLPFEGDSTLSLILSKAFLLADDHKIKDSTIRSQIGR